MGLRLMTDMISLLEGLVFRTGLLENNESYLER